MEHVDARSHRIPTFDKRLSLLWWKQAEASEVDALLVNLSLREVRGDRQVNREVGRESESSAPHSGRQLRTRRTLLLDALGVPPR